MGVLDGLLDFLSLKGKPSDKDKDESDEYTLETLAIGSFPMTDALARRKQYDELCSRYGITRGKEGGFV